MAGSTSTSAADEDAVYGWEISVLFLGFMLISIGWQLFIAVISFVNGLYGGAKTFWLQRLREEVLDVGVISLVLVFIQPHIAGICVKSHGKASTSYPPPPPEGGGRRQLLAGGAADPCFDGERHLFPADTIATAHYLLFFVAIVHIVYSLFTFTLTLQRFARWSRWERLARLEAADNADALEEQDAKARKKRGAGSGLWRWLSRITRPALGGVDRECYFVMRGLFQLRAKYYKVAAFVDTLHYTNVCENAMEIDIANVVSHGWLQAMIVAIFTLYTTEAYQLLWIGGVSVVVQALVVWKMAAIVSTVLDIVRVAGDQGSSSASYEIDYAGSEFQALVAHGESFIAPPEESSSSEDEPEVRQRGGVLQQQKSGKRGSGAWGSLGLRRPSNTINGKGPMGTTASRRYSGSNMGHIDMGQANGAVAVQGSALNWSRMSGGGGGGGGSGSGGGGAAGAAGHRRASGPGPGPGPVGEALEPSFLRPVADDGDDESTTQEHVNRMALAGGAASHSRPGSAGAAASASAAAAAAPDALSPVDTSPLPSPLASPTTLPPLRHLPPVLPNRRHPSALDMPRSAYSNPLFDDGKRRSRKGDAAAGADPGDDDADAAAPSAAGGASWQAAGENPAAEQRTQSCPPTAAPAPAAVASSVKAAAVLATPPPGDPGEGEPISAALVSSPSPPLAGPQPAPAPAPAPHEVIRSDPALAPAASASPEPPARRAPPSPLPRNDLAFTPTSRPPSATTIGATAVPPVHRTASTMSSASAAPPSAAAATASLGSADMMLVERKLRGLFWLRRPQLLLWLSHINFVQNSLSITLCIYYTVSYGETIFTVEAGLLYVWLPLLAANVLFMVYMGWVVVPVYTLVATTCWRQPRELHNHIRRHKKAEEEEEGGITGFLLELFQRLFRRTHHQAMRSHMKHGHATAQRGALNNVFMANLANQAGVIMATDSGTGRQKRLGPCEPVYREYVEVWRSKVRIAHGVEQPPPDGFMLNADVDDFRTAFLSLDVDGSSNVSTEELFTQLHVLGTRATKTELKSMIRQIDHDGDKRVDFEEFVVFMVFAFFDENGNSCVEVSDIVKVLKKLKVTATQHEVEAMVELADPDGDRKIGMRQFFRLFKDVRIPELGPRPASASGKHSGHGGEGLGGGFVGHSGGSVSHHLAAAVAAAGGRSFIGAAVGPGPGPGPRSASQVYHHPIYGAQLHAPTGSPSSTGSAASPAALRSRLARVSATTPLNAAAAVAAAPPSPTAAAGVAAVVVTDASAPSTAKDKTGGDEEHGAEARGAGMHGPRPTTPPPAPAEGPAAGALGLGQQGQVAAVAPGLLPPVCTHHHHAPGTDAGAASPGPGQLQAHGSPHSAAVSTPPPLAAGVVDYAPPLAPAPPSGAVADGPQSPRSFGGGQRLRTRMMGTPASGPVPNAGEG